MHSYFKDVALDMPISRVPVLSDSQSTRENATIWNYGYNHSSEVTSGVKKLPNGDLAAGLQFGYQFDAIGNREWAKSGGTSTLDQGQRTVNYTPNALNQYTEITTPGSFDVLVKSPDSVGVSVNGTLAAVTTQGDFLRAEATSANTSGARAALNITSPAGQNSVTGHRWLPPASVNPRRKSPHRRPLDQHLGRE